MARFACRIIGLYRFGLSRFHIKIERLIDQVIGPVIYHLFGYWKIGFHGLPLEKSIVSFPLTT